MTRPRTIATVVIAATIMLGAEGAAQADVHAGIGISISPHAGIGVWVGAPARGPVVVGRPRREVIRPRRHRVVRVVTPTPVYIPTPVVVPAPPVYDIDVANVTVWITNSNGSRTSVRLTRRGGYYFGPRGECYSSLPTNEQLRMVYGF